MFDSKDLITLDRDHLDVSFRAKDAWPSMTPAGVDQVLRVRHRRPLVRHDNRRRPSDQFRIRSCREGL